MVVEVNDRQRLLEEFFEDVQVREDYDPYHYVLGLDPGGTTGVALLRYTADTPPELVYLHQVENGREGFFNFFSGSSPTEKSSFVSEQWVNHGVPGANLEPVYIEGIQLALWLGNITYQEPKKKAVITDEWLKEQNLWVEGKPHEMDALRHALVFLFEKSHKGTVAAVLGQDSKGNEVEKLAREGEAKAKQLSGEYKTAAEVDLHRLAHEEAERVLEEFNEQQDVPEEFELSERREMELNGAFAGFTAVDESDATVLFED